MRSAFPLILLGFLTVATVVAEAPLPNPKILRQDKVPYRGWEFLAEKLKADGVDERTITKIFEDPRMPMSEPIHFSLEPRDNEALYRGFTQAARLAQAQDCLNRHMAAFAKAESDYGVSRYVVAAILMIETHCGKVTGSSTILNRLARVASVASPGNLKYNMRVHGAKKSLRVAKQVRDRAAYLEQAFYPEIPALIEVAKRNEISIFDIKGSYAGAFGISQFLPSTYLKFGVDGNGNGRVSLFEHADAIASTANFLSSYGWKDNASLDDKRRAIWRYNHCGAYVDAVLKVAAALQTT